MNLFSAIPFLRLMLPFAAGILTALALGCPEISSLYCGCLAGLAIVVNLFTSYKKLALLLADAFLVLYGVTLISSASISHNALFYATVAPVDSTQHIIAVVNDVPSEKANTVKCELRLLQLKRDTAYIPVKGTVLAYFKRPVAAGALRAGTVLLITTKLSAVSPPMNPLEFDYRSYLQRRQVYHTAFVDQGTYAVLPVASPLHPLWQFGLDCRQEVLARLKSSGLSGTAYAICCALLTGYDDEIDRPVMEAFSHSGTLHVLSVSGLHTGLIYLVFCFLFDLLDRGRRYKLLRFVLVILVLWGFALLTGFSAPVLRAVIMFTLFGVGNIFFRNDPRNQFNILLVSAFFQLSYNPFLVSDVGFLLSYLALAGLIYFQPRFSNLWQPKWRVTDYVWKSVTASAAATLSTLPVTLFYFKQFPIWFFVCNLVVVPLTFVLLLLAVLVVGGLLPAVWLINHLTDWLLAFIRFFDSRQWGFIDNIHFDGQDVAFLSVLILFMSAALYYRSFRLTLASLVLLISWQAASLLSSYSAKQSSRLSVYHLKRKSLLGIKNTTASCFSDSLFPGDQFHIKAHYISFNYSRMSVQPFNYIRSGHRHILILNAANRWPVVDAKLVTDLVLTNNIKLTDADLRRFTGLKIIVADGSNNSYSVKKAEELSRNFGIDFYSTARKGAYLLTL